MLTQNEFQIYNSIVRNIYASSSLQELRINLLSGLHSLVPYYIAAFYLINPQTLELTEPLVYSPYFSVSQATNIHSQLHDMNSGISQANIPIVNRSSDYINYSAKDRTEHRSEFTLPQDIHYIACMQIFHQGLLNGKLSLHRNQEQSDFSDEEMLILKLLYEHINDRFSELYAFTLSNQPTNKEEWNLTKREAQIASLVTCGRTNRQIAIDLGVSENTIKTFLKRLFNKMGVHSRSELINALYKLAPLGN